MHQGKNVEMRTKLRGDKNMKTKTVNKKDYSKLFVVLIITLILIGVLSLVGYILLNQPVEPAKQISIDKPLIVVGCGNGLCETDLNETFYSCSSDCGSTGGGLDLSAGPGGISWIIWVLAMILAFKFIQAFT